jgi:hypothetical protein
MAFGVIDQCIKTTWFSTAHDKFIKSSSTPRQGSRTAPLDPHRASGSLDVPARSVHTF